MAPAPRRMDQEPCRALPFDPFWCFILVSLHRTVDTVDTYSKCAKSSLGLPFSMLHASSVSILEGVFQSSKVASKLTSAQALSHVCGKRTVSGGQGKRTSLNHRLGRLVDSPQKTGLSLADSVCGNLERWHNPSAKDAILSRIPQIKEDVDPIEVPRSTKKDVAHSMRPPSWPCHYRCHQTWLAGNHFAAMVWCTLGVASWAGHFQPWSQKPILCAWDHPSSFRRQIDIR